MDKKTMDKELDKLVEDSGFLRYHAEYVKAAGVQYLRRPALRGIRDPPQQRAGLVA